MDFSFDVQGLENLEAQLTELGLDTQRKAYREALRFAAKPILSTMKRLAVMQGHEDTGHLSRSFALKVSARKSLQRQGVDMQATIGVYKNKREVKVRRVRNADGSTRYTTAVDAAVYAYWLEHGVEPHSIGKSGGRHPGFRAKPFIRPALKSNSRNVTQRFAEKAKRRIELIAQKRNK